MALVRRGSLALIVIGLFTTAPAHAAVHKLRWPPPELTNPTTIRLGNGFTVSQLDTSRDYIIKLPRGLKTGGTVIEGGRNVVIEGGHVTVPPSADQDFERRGIYVDGAVGTVHIEGVLISGIPMSPLDAIAINAPQATVQIENVRATGITGTEEGFHADVVQPWGGVRQLRIDRLTGFSDYQGLFIPPAAESMGTSLIRHVNLVHTALPTDGGGYLVWLADQCNADQIHLRGVYVRSVIPRPLGMMVFPWTGQPGCAARISDGAASWPQLSIFGRVHDGRPPHGSFVPKGVAGSRYHSPGYIYPHYRPGRK